MGGTNSCKYVYMIGGPVNDERGPAHFANDSAEVSEKIRADFGSYERESFLRAEDQVKNDVSAGLRHLCLSPFQGFSTFADPCLTAWAALLRRFAAGVAVEAARNGARFGRSKRPLNPLPPDEVLVSPLV